MDKNVKSIFLVLTVVTLFVAISTVSAGDVSYDTLITDSMQDNVVNDTSQVISSDEVVTKEVQTPSDNSVETNTENEINKDHKNIKTEPKTIIVNNDTVDYVFSGEEWGLNDSINPGDILDFQGVINKEHRLLFNKPINVISSTNDAYIDLNTTKYWLSENSSYWVSCDDYSYEPRVTFKIDNSGSYSNFTGLIINNTQIWIFNSTHVTFDNMSVYGEGGVGNNIGYFAIRTNSSYFTMRNSYLYKEHSGSSMLVFTGADNCLIENCTIISNSTGNVVYWNWYNKDIDNESIYIYRNTNNTLKNCTILTTSDSSICIPTAIGPATNATVIDNKYYGIGNGISGTPMMEYMILDSNNLIMNNEFYGTQGINYYGKIINNTIYGTGKLSILSNSEIYNNTIKYIDFSTGNTNNVTFENNTVTNYAKFGQPINLSKNNFNTLTMYNNSAGSNITNNTFSNIVTINVDDVLFEGNTIVSNDKLALVVKGNNNTIINNFISTRSNVGKEVVEITDNNIYENNLPEKSMLNITNNNYYEYFNNQGILLNDKAENYSFLILYGTFINKNFTFDNTAKIINGKQAKLINTTIKTLNNSHITLSDLIINNTNSNQETIILNSTNNLLYNIIIYTTNNIKILKDQNEITNNQIYINNPQTINAIEINSNKNIIRNNRIELNAQNGSLINIQKTNTVLENNIIDQNNININTLNINALLIETTTSDMEITHNNISITSINSTAITINSINNQKTVIANNTIKNNGTSIIIENSENNIIGDNNLISTNNIQLYNTTKTNITNNNLKANENNIILLNSNENNIINNIVNVNNNYTITLTNSSNNKIINNTLNKQNMIYDESTIIEDENSLNNTKDNENTIKTSLILTEDNFDEIFDENGNFKYYNQYDQLILGSDLFNKDIIFNNNLYFTNKWEYTLYNTTIHKKDNCTLILDKINFNNVDKSIIILDNTTGVTLINSNISISGNNITAIDTNGISLAQNTITQNYFNLTGENVILLRSNMGNHMSGSTQHLNENTILVNARDNIKVLEFELGGNINLTKNNIKLKAENASLISGNVRLSGKILNNNTIEIQGNDISILNINNSAGISQIGGNNIILSSDKPINAFKFEGLGYPIIGKGTGMNSNPNTIIINATQNGTPAINITKKGTSVQDNYIISKDNYGNNLIQAYTVKSNTPFSLTPITITVETEEINSINNTIICKINDEIGFVETGNITLNINNQEIKTTIEKGQATIPIKVTNTTETIGTITFTDNQHENKTESIFLRMIQTKIPIENITATIGKKINITAKITLNEDTITQINTGKISFKVNGKTLKDTNGKTIYTKVVEGIATIENYVVPDEWAKEGTTIQAVYSGSTQLEKLNSEKTNITITPKEITLTTEPITATTGTTTTLTATLSDNTINTGKIIFKINGKTVKDANGKVIYAKVVNGTVSVDYIIPDSMKAGNYTITITYIPTSGERLTSNSTLTVTKA